MPNRLEGVDPMVLEIMSALEGDLPADVRARAQLCLSEALYNLVIHASTTDPSAPIDIVLADEATKVVIEIHDPPGAEAFDLRRHAATLSEIDLMAEGGRGLALIMECADSVEYGPSNGRNRLAIGFERQPDGRA